MKNPDEKIIATTIRIPESLKKNLEIISKDEQRSFNNTVSIILQKYVKAYQKKKEGQTNK